MGELPLNHDPELKIITANWTHAPAITEIYRSAMIPAGVFVDLVGDEKQRQTAKQAIRDHGGFISPPQPAEMEWSLDHGLVFIGLHGDTVIGFNRIVTGAKEVWLSLCKEFQINPLNPPRTPEDFIDWQGERRLSDRKTLKRIHWVNPGQAARVFQAAESRAGGDDLCGLIWAVDSAVHPGFRKSGVAGAMVDAIRLKLGPTNPLRAFRMFELLKVNGQAVREENLPSKTTFITNSSTRFAFTEEEIVLSANLILTVRWNQWVKSA